MTTKETLTVTVPPLLDLPAEPLDLSDFDALDERDAAQAETARTLVSDLPARPGTIR